MRSSKEHVLKVYQLAHGELIKTKWKKRKAGIFTFDLNDETLGWVGLNTAHYQDGIAINPVVGVRHQKLEAVIAECLNLKPSQYIPVSFSSPMAT